MPTTAPASPIAVIAEQVRERVRRDGADLGSDAELVGRYVRDEVRRYSERALGGSALLQMGASRHVKSAPPLMPGVPLGNVATCAVG